MADDPSSRYRLETRGIVAAGAPVAITVDGRTVAARPGETVAAALIAAGIATFRSTREGRPRGPFCGMGVCFDCVVAIDGRGGQRACLAKIAPSMSVATGTAVPAAAPCPAWSEHGAEILVLGAGPAGLAAAIAARRRGAEVTILDERPEPGGQFYKPLAAGHRFTGTAALDRQFTAGRQSIEAAARLGVAIRLGTTVWDATARPEGGATLHALREGHVERWTARRLIVATGAFERPWMVPGWTLPGVMTTGAMQTLARAYRVTPGRRVLIAGNGPLNLQLAVELLRGGVAVLALAEAAAPPWRAAPSDLAILARAATDLLRDGLAYRAALARHRVPILHRHVLAGLAGADAVGEATLMRIDDAGRPVPGSERRFAVDAVAMGYGFLPSSELTQLIGCRHAVDTRGLGLQGLAAERDEDGRTSVAGVLVAGDAGGLGGARIAEAEGTLAGQAAARDLGHGRDDPDAAAAARRARTRHRSFQAALWRVFAAPPLAAPFAEDDTLLCRCESVSWGTVRGAMEGGCTTPSAIKRATRCGMGRCQGRYCGPVLAELCGTAERLAARLPAKPVPVAALAAGPAAAPGPAIALKDAPALQLARRDLGRSDIAVIGGGIVGLCAARALALAGAEVTVVERARPTAEATQGNAGSLHVQLLAYAHPDLDTPDARAALASLRAHAASVRLWQALAPTLDADIELKVVGGLAVADDPNQLDRLRRKADLERAAGIDVRLVSGAEARSLAPALSPQVLAATWCPDEGKLNPLIAGPAIARAAIAAGVRIIAEARLGAVAAEPDHYVLHTAQGRLKAGRVLNAAGGWAPEIAGLIGATLPVRATPLHMIVTEAAPPLVDRLIAHASDRLTVKQAAAGNLIIGGGWRAVADPVNGHPRPGIAAIAGNLAVALRVLPGLGGLQVIRSWTAVNSGTAGGPVLRAMPGHPRFFAAVTMNGLTLGPAIGAAAADLVLGRRRDRDLWPEG